MQSSRLGKSKSAHLLRSTREGDEMIRGDEEEAEP